MRICKTSDDIVLSTSKGNIVRQRVSDLSIQGRTATGFVIQKLVKDDSIVMVDIVPPGDPSEVEEGGEELGAAVEETLDELAVV